MRHLLLIAALSMAGSALKAQQDTTMLLGLGFGGNAYRGDLSASFSNYTPSLEASFKLNSQKRLSGLFYASLGYLEGQNPDYLVETDAPEIYPNKYFKTSVFTIGYQLQYMFYRRKTFSVFAALGIGLLRFTPRDENGNKLIDQRNTRVRNETYGNTAAIIPFSMGVRKQLPNKMELCATWCLLNSNTDYLDNISQLGNRGGNDNIMKFKLELLLPIARKEHVTVLQDRYEDLSK